MYAGTHGSRRQSQEIPVGKVWRGAGAVDCPALDDKAIRSIRVPIALSHGDSYSDFVTKLAGCTNQQPPLLRRREVATTSFKQLSLFIPPSISLYGRTSLYVRTYILIYINIHTSFAYCGPCITTTLFAERSGLSCRTMLLLSASSSSPSIYIPDIVIILSRLTPSDPSTPRKQA